MPPEEDDDDSGSSGSLVLVAHEETENPKRAAMMATGTSSSSTESPSKLHESHLHQSMDTTAASTEASSESLGSLLSYNSGSGSSGDYISYYTLSYDQNPSRDVLRVGRSPTRNNNGTEACAHVNQSRCSSETARLHASPQIMLQDQHFRKEAERACIDQGVIPQIPKLPPELIKPAPGSSNSRSTLRRQSEPSTAPAIVKAENHADFPAVENVARLPASTNPENNILDRKMTPAERAAERHNERMARELALVEQLDSSHGYPEAVAVAAEKQQWVDNDEDEDDKKPAAIEHPPRSKQQVPIKSSLASPKRERSPRGRVSFAGVSGNINSNAAKPKGLKVPNLYDEDEDLEEPSEAPSVAAIPTPRGRGLRGRRNQEDREARRQRILNRATATDTNNASRSRSTSPTAQPSVAAPQEPGQSATPQLAPGDSLANAPQPIASRAVPRTDTPPNQKISNPTPDAYEDQESSELSEKERIRRENQALPSSIRPGAYKDVPGRGLIRNDTLRFSIVNNLRKQRESLRKMFSSRRGGLSSSSRRGLSASDSAYLTRRACARCAADGSNIRPRGSNHSSLSDAARESLCSQCGSKQQQLQRGSSDTRLLFRHSAMRKTDSCTSMLSSIPSVLVEDDVDAIDYVGKLSTRSLTAAQNAGGLSVARPVFTKDPSLAVCTPHPCTTIAEAEMIAAAEPVLLSQDEQDNMAKKRAKPRKLLHRIRPPKMTLKGVPNLPAMFRRKKSPKRSKSGGGRPKRTRAKENPKKRVSSTRRHSF